MEMLQVEIGGFDLSFIPPKSGLRVKNSYLPFLSRPGPRAAAQWRAVRGPIPESWQSPSLSGPPFPRWEISSDNGARIFRLRKKADSPQLWQAARMNADLSRGEIRTEGAEGAIACPPREIDQLLFAHFLQPRGGLIVHAAGAEIGGRGYLFPAPAGGGKSTWAGLLSSGGGNVLGEDKIILRAIDGELWIFGAPWNPRPEFRKNESAPLEGIYFLRHGRKNRLATRGRTEALGELIQETFLPFSARKEMEEAVSLLEIACRRTPIRRFEFRPEKSAAAYFNETLRTGI